MNDYIDSWKNRSVFERQKDLNKSELQNYPIHWRGFISAMAMIEKKDSLLDIGCGSGIFYALCKKEFPNLKYFGLDYSEEAIEISKKENNINCFEVKDVNDLDKNYVENFDVLLLNGLLAILPNGDEILKKILSLEVKNIIVCRIKLTNEPSHYEIYDAYNLIKTYEYYHNKNNFHKLLEEFNYSLNVISLHNETFLLRKTS